MRRADRLLQILQILRRERRPIAASRMAEELEVSLRTLYRDMVALEASGVPVRGEAGVGYVLEDGFDVPPLMFTTNELEAIMLGARLVDGVGDSDLSRSAKDAIAKIAAVIPAPLRDRLVDTPLFAPQFERDDRPQLDIAVFREILREEKQVTIDYRDLKGQRSRRTVWPIQLSFFRNAVLLVGWCTMREAFRSFRVDGIEHHVVLDARLPVRRKTLFVRWLKDRDTRKHEWGETAVDLSRLRGV
ncbi:MAG: YafY family protein [Pseudomonadota bacterium]